MLSRLRGKKIAIVGMGVNNRKLADYLSKHGIKFEVIDGWNKPEDLIGRLDRFDVVFRTPGLPYLSAAVQQAKQKGVEIFSQTKFFFELCPAPIIGITGTKGKGTTSSLIAKILETSGKKIWLGGNIGKDPFEFLEQIKPEDLVILELSSFQLQDMTQSPHVALVLSITSDHLDHHQSVDEYVSAKSSILKFQTEKDVAILHPSLPDAFKNLGKGKKIIYDPGSAQDYETKLLGQHNKENIAAAAAVAKFLGVEESEIRTAVAEFETLPHHLEVLRTVNGITYIDDAVSTNVEPAIAAINAITTPLILIVGGFDKGVDFEPLGKVIVSAKNLKAVVVIGDVTDKILKIIAGFKGKILTGAKNMNEILSQAQSVATAGDTIVISPATSSFDMFANMYDRAEQFVKAVKAL